MQTIYDTRIEIDEFLENVRGFKDLVKNIELNRHIDAIDDYAEEYELYKFTDDGIGLFKEQCVVLDNEANQIVINRWRNYEHKDTIEYTHYITIYQKLLKINKEANFEMQGLHKMLEIRFVISDFVKNEKHIRAYSAMLLNTLNLKIKEGLFQ